MKLVQSYVLLSKYLTHNQQMKKVYCFCLEGKPSVQPFVLGRKYYNLHFLIHVVLNSNFVNSTVSCLACFGAECAGAALPARNLI